VSRRPRGALPWMFSRAGDRQLHGDADAQKDRRARTCAPYKRRSMSCVAQTCVRRVRFASTAPHGWGCARRGPSPRASPRFVPVSFQQRRNSAAIGSAAEGLDGDCPTYGQNARTACCR
jgi:hypothetical protein